MIYNYGNYYHLINRGCNRESIFKCEADYLELINRIKSSNHNSLVKIISWCLMPNHYHFLVQQNSDKPASSWIRYIFNGYAQYFNKKYKRTGTLFEGRVRPKLITSNDYLFQVITYIHLNPVLANLVERPQDWHFSNFSDWIGKAHTQLTDYNLRDEYFNSGKEYQKQVEKTLKDKLLQKELSESDIEF